MMKATTLLLTAALAVSIHSAQAATGTWTGATGNWNVNGNWTGASYPGTGVSESATFNANVPNSTVSMNGATIALDSIVFNTNAESYTFDAVGGGSLQTRAITINSSVGAVTQTFNLAVNIGPGTFANPSPYSTYNNNSTSAFLNFAAGVNNSIVTAEVIRFGGVGTTSVNGLTETGGAMGFEKRDAGKLILTGASSNTGSNKILGGILQLNSMGALSNANVHLGVGIIGLGSGNFTRGVGSGSGAIRWIAGTGDTGFAAYGADRNVNLGGAGATYTWGVTSLFITNAQNLALGSADSTHKVIFQNGLNLGDQARTIVVNDGTSSTNIDGEFSGTISSTVAASGSLIKTGAGTLLLSGTNTYTGLTTVSLGTLLVGNSSGVGSLAGGVTVDSGAVLGGSGNIAGEVTINGSLRPGNSLGTLTVHNDVTWTGGDDWVFELGTAALTLADANTGLGNIQDQLNITSGGDFLKAGSGWTFDFAGTGAAGWYKIVDWAGTTDFVAGNFALPLNLTSGLSGTFTVDAGTSALYLNVVPEPATWLLLGLGGLILLTFRRRAHC